jgi:hypothetical protein
MTFPARIPHRPRPLKHDSLPPLPLRPIKDRRELYAELGLGVTIGIAALNIYDGCFVTVSDRRLSYDDLVEATDDGVNKTWGLGPTWGALYAANDITPVAPLMTGINKRLDPHRGGGLTAKVVEEAAREAYHDIVCDQIVTKYLSRFGLRDLAEFRHRGLKQFGRAVFKEICDRIDKFDLGVSLLIFGFEEADGVEGASLNSHLFEVSNPGLIHDHNAYGFWTIGSGYLQALAALSGRGTRQFQDVSETVYRLCEAKFCAETTVGKATTVWVHFQDGRIRQFHDDEIDRMREIWATLRNQPIPSEARRIIQKRLSKPYWTPGKARNEIANLESYDDSAAISSKDQT